MSCVKFSLDLRIELHQKISFLVQFINFIKNDFYGLKLIKPLLSC